MCRVSTHLKVCGFAADEFYKTEYDVIISEIAEKPVTSMYATFGQCYFLAVAPAIPSSVKYMTATFIQCTSLTTAPKIPNSVTNMMTTFNGCTSLTTAPEIPNKVTNMLGTFFDCTSLTGTIKINANPTDCGSCFTETEKSITLTGSSTKLAELAATANNGNVTVA